MDLILNAGKNRVVTVNTLCTIVIKIMVAKNSWRERFHLWLTSQSESNISPFGRCSQPVAGLLAFPQACIIHQTTVIAYVPHSTFPLYVG